MDAEEILLYYDCCKYNRKWLLIELMLDEYSDKINLEGFTVPEGNLKESDWQVPYLVQFLSEDGSKAISGLDEAPAIPVKPCRFAFFIYKTSGDTLRTPYGEFSLERPQKITKRLKRLIKFEKPD